MWTRRLKHDVTDLIKGTFADAPVSAVAELEDALRETLAGEGAPASVFICAHPLVLCYLLDRVVAPAPLLIHVVSQTNFT